MTVKVSKSAAGYERAPGAGGCDVGPQPCANYRGGTCIKVKGSIADEACCNYYTAKPVADPGEMVSKSEAGYVEAPGHWQFLCNDCDLLRIMQEARATNFSCARVSGDVRPEDVCVELWTPGKDHGFISKGGKPLEH